MNEIEKKGNIFFLLRLFNKEKRDNSWRNNKEYEPILLIFITNRFQYVCKFFSWIQANLLIYHKIFDIVNNK